MELVGRYRVERRLGSGAFSTVWLAHDDALDIPVAVKILGDNWIDNADMRTRFLDEARHLRRISDPHVIGVHDLGTLPDGRDFFVMDYADGGTLADLARDPIPVPEALALGAELARGAAVLHRHGILHRDLKPANILLITRDGRRHPVIADLGMAKRLAEASGLTVAAGTPGYMAPEQARGLGLDERTDVYGAAAVCYRMITGEVPFPGDDLTAVANRPVDRLPAPLPPAVLPSGVDALLRSALSGDPDRRPPNATALADGLETTTRTRPSVAPIPRLPTQVRGPAAQRHATAAARADHPAAVRRTGVGGIVAVAAVGLAAAIVTWLLLSLLIAR